ncbi:hypothetical protein RirG_116700 [Rhizophagus irregularis DAOM 197198w]|uniref:Uncharacterized protein n=1 Tax=Rhizophagus irregularis (strain DAOM 197198w) TaxID=1432141 RepID=A0A015L430_RHIIW|nr:hypothetical protein RirG_116700 [Rhizophagus irregularis DAOM 197198w]
MDAIEIKIKGTETDKDVDESANGEEITYVAISPDGSIVAKFNPCKLRIIITTLPYQLKK